jgi:hypothetical protein
VQAGREAAIHLNNNNNNSNNNDDDDDDTHTTTESANVKVKKNIFCRKNNIICCPNCKQRTAATLYTLETRFISGI